MPYYCTVPRCTSMAGKAKNVSFHQFPRDEELARLWNKILKRGKPYTKYSKVCSLHFTPEDYTINSVGKKGQWRSLRKDAVPSRNLPSESPIPYRRDSSSQAPTLSPSLMDPQIQQQFAQAIYVQTMLAMQAANFRESNGDTQTMDLSVKQKDSPTSSNDSTNQDAPNQASINLAASTSELQKYMQTYTNQNLHKHTYKCDECSRFFKDPDVFLLHQRTHGVATTKNDVSTEKENIEYDNNLKQETLLANPILANLLKPKVPDHVMAMALSMEAFVKNLKMAANNLNSECSDSDSNDRCEDLNESGESNRLVIDETA